MKTIHRYILILIGAMLWIGCDAGTPTTGPAVSAPVTESPAEAYCRGQGQTPRIRKNDKGFQMTTCILEDGTECDADAYLNGDCPNPAAVYCERKGNEYEVITQNGEAIEVCIMPDETTCELWDFFYGDCP